MRQEGAAGCKKVIHSGEIPRFCVARRVLLSHTAMPMTTSSPTARRAPRWSTRLPVRYQVFDARSGQLNVGRLATARARDIGPNGLFLSQVELPPGTPLRFFFELPETWGGCIEAFGRVVHGR